MGRGGEGRGGVDKGREGVMVVEGERCRAEWRCTKKRGYYGTGMDRTCQGSTRRSSATFRPLGSLDYFLFHFT